MEHLLCLDVNSYQIDKNKYKTPFLYETWTWEGDEHVLPYKWVTLIKLAKMNGFKDLTQEKAFNEVKEMLKGSYYGKDNFDRLSFFFITCRSEVTGCAYLNVNNDNVIEYLIVNPKHFGKGVEKGLFSLIYNRAKALNIGEIKVDLEKTNIGKEFFEEIGFK